MSIPNRASEELVAAPLPELVRDLGLAVAAANKAMKEADGDLAFLVQEAEVEVAVAITIDKETQTKIEGGGSLSVFSVNASYSNTFGYKEEASSRIKLKLATVLKPAPAA